MRCKTKNACCARCPVVGQTRRSASIQPPLKTQFKDVVVIGMFKKYSVVYLRIIDQLCMFSVIDLRKRTLRHHAFLSAVRSLALLQRPRRRWTSARLFACKTGVLYWYTTGFARLEATRRGLQFQNLLVELVFSCHYAPIGSRRSLLQPGIFALWHLKSPWCRHWPRFPFVA